MFLRLVQAEALQLRQGGIDLAEVGARSGDDDAQLGRGLGIQLIRLCRPGQLDRLLGMAESSLTVGHHREMSWAAAHPAGSAELADGLGPFAGPVRNQPDRLPDDTDPATSRPRCSRVAPCRFGLIVGQGSRGDEMGGHPVGAVLAQASKVAADLEVESVGGRPFRKIRPGLADVLFTTTRAAFRLPSRRPVVVVVTAPLSGVPIGSVGAGSLAAMPISGRAFGSASVLCSVARRSRVLLPRPSFPLVLDGSGRGVGCTRPEAFAQIAAEGGGARSVAVIPVRCGPLVATGSLVVAEVPPWPVAVGRTIALAARPITIAWAIRIAARPILIGRAVTA